MRIKHPGYWLEDFVRRLWRKLRKFARPSAAMAILRTRLRKLHRYVKIYLLTLRDVGEEGLTHLKKRFRNRMFRLAYAKKYVRVKIKLARRSIRHQSYQAIFSSILLIFAFIALAIWSDQAARDTARWLGSFTLPHWSKIPMWVWIATATIFVLWLLWNVTGRQGAVNTAKNFPYGKAIATVLVLMLATAMDYAIFNRFSSEQMADLTADTTRTIIVRPGQPAEAVMPPDWQVDWWGDPTKFDSHVMWRGRNKVRVFTTKAGVESAEIKIRVYPCSTEAPC